MCAVRDRKPGFDSEFNGCALKVKLRGEIDHHSAAAVRCAIDEMIRNKRPLELIIDMSAVDFMDSSGLGLIMGRYNTMKEIGGTLIVADPNSATEKIMSLAGMERIVKIVHTTKKKIQKKEVEPKAAAVMSNDTRAANKLGNPSSARKKSRGEKNEKRKI